MSNRTLSGNSRLVSRLRIYWTIGGLLMLVASFLGAGPVLGVERQGAAEMILVPSGTFIMGDAFLEGGAAERPAHEVYVSAFYIDRCEVLLDLWNEVYNWEGQHGYVLAECGPGQPRHPVYLVGWDDAVKWCNARSEKEGLTPVYYTNAQQEEIYHRGQADMNNACVRWEANGYRLPTEAEWEKAARGGLVGHHFPWPSASPGWTNHIRGNCANYWQSEDPYESKDPLDDATTPAGYYAAPPQRAGTGGTNGYELCDMAGNVWEWCWDWYAADYYRSSPVRDPRGPERGTVHSMRGGSWISSPDQLRCSYRNMYYLPSSRSWSCGMRCVRKAKESYETGSR